MKPFWRRVLIVLRHVSRIVFMFLLDVAVLHILGTALS